MERGMAPFESFFRIRPFLYDEDFFMFIFVYDWVFYFDRRYSLIFHSFWLLSSRLLLSMTLNSMLLALNA